MSIFLIAVCIVLGLGVIGIIAGGGKTKQDSGKTEITSQSTESSAADDNASPDKIASYKVIARKHHIQF